MTENEQLVGLLISSKHPLSSLSFGFRQKDQHLRLVVLSVFRLRMAQVALGSSTLHFSLQHHRAPQKATRELSIFQGETPHDQPTGSMNPTERFRGTNAIACYSQLC